MPDFYNNLLTCPSCDSTDFMRANDETEEQDGDETTPESVLYSDKDDAMCLNCGITLENSEFPWVSKYQNYCVGEVVESEAVGKGGKLLKLMVKIKESDETDESNSTVASSEEDASDGTVVQIVTNDTKIKLNELIIVALPGATVPAGSESCHL